MPWKVALSLYWSVMSYCLKHSLLHPELPGDITGIECIQKSTLLLFRSDMSLKCSHSCKLQQSNKQHQKNIHISVLHFWSSLLLHWSLLSSMCGLHIEQDWM